MVTYGEGSLRERPVDRAGPGFLCEALYEGLDLAHGGAADGPGQVDLLLRKSMIALLLRDRDEARAFIARAFRAPPGEGAVEPFVLGRALGLLGRELFRAVEAEGAGGDDEWLAVLRGAVQRPGDDVTLVCLAAMQAVASAYVLPEGVVEMIGEQTRRYCGADPRSPVARVLAGGAHEPDVVLDVLAVACSLAGVADDAQDRRGEEIEEAARRSWNG